MTAHRDPHESRAGGRELRYRLSLLLLEAGRPLTVRELLARLDASGYLVAGRASKTISDALRREIALGRVVRVSRSTYTTGVIPRSTEWSIRRWMRARDSSQRETSALSL